MFLLIILCSKILRVTVSILLSYLFLIKCELRLFYEKKETEK